MLLGCDLVEVTDYGLGNILRNGAIGASNTLGRRDTLSKAVGMEALAGFVCGSVVDIALFGQVYHAKYHFTVFRLSKVDVLGHHWVD